MEYKEWIGIFEEKNRKNQLAFEKWLDDFVVDNKLDAEELYAIEVEDGIDNIIPCQSVIDMLKHIATKDDQIRVKRLLDRMKKRGIPIKKYFEEAAWMLSEFLNDCGLEDGEFDLLELLKKHKPTLRLA